MSSLNSTAGNAPAFTLRMNSRTRDVEVRSPNGLWYPLGVASVPLVEQGSLNTLIAAAPELLAQLQDAEVTLSLRWSELDSEIRGADDSRSNGVLDLKRHELARLGRQIDAIRAAIAKVEGRS